VTALQDSLYDTQTAADQTDRICGMKPNDRVTSKPAAFAAFMSTNGVSAATAWSMLAKALHSRDSRAQTETEVATAVAN
jgi:cytochrome c-type biogenesis protein CcmH/NrfG